MALESLQLYAFPAAFASIVAILWSYVSGPGWLAHDPCPCCCWCSGGEPFGDRVERRLATVLGGDA